jgi:hypothetical protein
VNTQSPSARAPQAVTILVVVPEFAQSTTSSGTVGRPSNPETESRSSARSTLPPKASTARIVARVSALTSGSLTTASVP